MEKTILPQWLKAGFMDKAVLPATEAGVPQGAICAPVLANLRLDGLEAKLRERYPKAPARSRRAKVNLVRFAEDFLITGSSQERLETEVKPLVEQFLQERGLELSEEKTPLTHRKEGLEFLGQQVRQDKDKILVQPSRKRGHTLLTKVRALLKTQAPATTGNLLRQLNPLMRGWAYYHRHVSSKQTFATVEHALFLAVWQGAKRRHPHKSRRWITDAYCHVIDGCRWVFCGKRPGKDRRPQRVRLFAASSVALKRHPKSNGAAHPFDPVWEVYFEQRLGVTMADNLKGRRKLPYLGKEQNGRCPVCHQPITHLTGWDNHPLIWRTNGGADHAANRVLLHPTCHKQGHSQGLAVAQPRPLREV